MTNLRTAAQQALKALEKVKYGLWEEDSREGRALITALRAALAEPCPCGDRPAAQCPGEWEPGCDLGNNPKYARRVQEPVQEPVKQCMSHGECFGGECIYTSLPQRKPLSAVDLRALYDRHAAYQEEGPEISGWWDFARAIERAHKIGGEG
jgi:hypothetical protein